MYTQGHEWEYFLGVSGKISWDLWMTSRTEEGIQTGEVYIIDYDEHEYGISLILSYRGHIHTIEV
jgi:hypothetical protein